MNFSEFLQTVPLFAEFTQAELETLEHAMTVRGYPQGHIFIHEGEHAETMFLIIQGEVLASRKLQDRGRTEVIERMGAGDMFGLVALLDHRPRSIRYTAAQPVEAASLPRSAFNLLFEARAPIAYHFQFLIARQLARDAHTFAQAIYEAFHSAHVHPSLPTVPSTESP